VRQLLKLPGNPQADAADALAVALCHTHTMQSLIRMAGRGSTVQGVVRGRLR
jgi:crossover junction endodeoxyribonuclease RuvC